jgi:hypothetical protein
VVTIRPLTHAAVVVVVKGGGSSPIAPTDERGAQNRDVPSASSLSEKSVARPQ